MKAAWFGACAVVLGSGATLFAAEAFVVSVASHGGSATVTAWAGYDGNGFGFARGRSVGFGEDGFSQSQSYAVASRLGSSMRGTTNPYSSLGRGSSVHTGRVRSNGYPSRRATVRGLAGSHRSQRQAVSATHSTNGSRRAVRARTRSAQRRGFASRRHETRRSHGNRRSHR